MKVCYAIIHLTFIDIPVPVILENAPQTRHFVCCFEVAKWKH